MKLQNWASEQRGRGLLLANALGVQPPSVSQWLTGKKPVPLERCTAIERATGGAVTRQDLRPNDWQEIWPELAQAQAAPALAATEFIAVVKAAIDEIVHHADDLLAELKKDAQVEIKHTSVEVRGEIEKEAHDAMERLAEHKPWDGINRRADGATVAAEWDGKERRRTADRRDPEVLESPAPIFTADAVAMDKLITR